MLKYLTRCALRVSSIAIPLIALMFAAGAFIAGAPTPAKAYSCSDIESAAFPNLPNETGGGPVIGCTATINVDNNGVLSVQQNLHPAYDNSGDSIVAFTNDSSSSIYDLFIWGTTNAPIFDPSRPSSELLCNLKSATCGTGATGDQGAILDTLGNKVGFVLFTDIGTANIPGIVCTLDNCADLLFDIGGVTTNGLPAGYTAIFGLTEPQFSAALSGPNQVPEPGSFAVLATGLFGLAFYRFRLRRRRRVAARLKPQHA